MDYQIFINGQSLISGSIITVIIVLVLVIIALIIAGKLTWKKLRAYENLKYEFVTIIAHKFRTPLTQMKWIVETILESEQDSFKRENLTALGKSNEKLINLTGTLIELTDSANRTLASYSFERLNICEMTNKVANSLADHFHEKNLFFGIKCSEPEIYAKVDRPRMEFVLQTLIENSINYSFTGRNVDIQVSTLKNKAVIDVIDHGIGIKPEDLSHVFTKFFRTDRSKTMYTEGFGVGLFLAKSIVERHGGNMSVFSEGQDKGTTFTVTIPLAG